MAPWIALAAAAGILGYMSQAPTRTVRVTAPNGAVRKWFLYRKHMNETPPGRVWEVWTPARQFGPHKKAVVLSFRQLDDGTRELHSSHTGAFGRSVYEAAAKDNNVNYPSDWDWGLEPGEVLR
jgi:hypothetical protein